MKLQDINNRLYKLEIQIENCILLADILGERHIMSEQYHTPISQELGELNEFIITVKVYQLQVIEKVKKLLTIPDFKLVEEMLLLMPDKYFDEVIEYINILVEKNWNHVILLGEDNDIE